MNNTSLAPWMITTFPKIDVGVHCYRIQNMTLTEIRWKAAKMYCDYFFLLLLSFKPAVIGTDLTGGCRLACVK